MTESEANVDVLERDGARKNQEGSKQAPQNIAKPIPTRNKLVLCVWWDWKSINHYELLPLGKTINLDLYCQQLMKFTFRFSHRSLFWLQTAFGDEAPCKTTIYNWFAEFKHSRINLSDSRPFTTVNNKIIDAVLRMIKTDRHVTYHENRASLGTGINEIQSILNKHLGFKENLVWHIVPGDETWTYCYDSKTKQQLTAWLYRDEPKPTEVVRERSTSKRMIASFFNKTGHVGIVALENCRTMNSDRYTTIYLPELSQRENCQILQLAFGDEAPSSSSVYSWFSEIRYGRILRFEDLSEDKLRVTRFTNHPEVVVNAFQETNEDIHKGDWADCFLQRHAIYIPIVVPGFIYPTFEPHPPSIFPHRIEGLEPLRAPRQYGVGAVFGYRHQREDNVQDRRPNVLSEARSKRLTLRHVPRVDGDTPLSEFYGAREINSAHLLVRYGAAESEALELFPSSSA
ncbi:hypothetical protein EVAR_48076_1 [Eumeta japonica]|uniref:Mariner Mos1 transposase n=1 Tax=Eumeta variegata TaxID=151549 RepID=A0A4C1X7S3_EUMVA|nr:hypothetical protein EVAR_48076_1 [Eumeta japonica]